MKEILVFLGIICSLSFASCSSPAEQEFNDTQRLQWWDDAKFGLFIHWGVYAVPAGIYQEREIPGIGEWIMQRARIPVAEYRKFAGEFNPVRYDPDKWVKMAKDAGMKYIVITSKHHDGFALFETEVSDWNVVDATPYGSDLLQPLAEACRREGIRLGFYYSQVQDWYHPGGAADGGHWDEAQHGCFDEYLDNIAIPQLKEILTNYGEIDILWWDTPRDHITTEQAERFLPVIAEHPDIITNNRIGGGLGGDFFTPERYIPITGFPGYRWEVCMTMNNTWGYKSFDHDWKSTRELILQLSHIVSKGGNFLLNVGPTAEGEIPQPSIERLQQIGEWMKTNSEAIHGTQASPFSYLPWGTATIKDQKLYLHVVSWPEDGLLKLPLINKPLNAYTLASPGSPLTVRQDSGEIEISVPAEAPDDILSIVVLEFEGEPNVQPPPTTGKTAKASSVDRETSLSNLFDDDLNSQWKPLDGENKAWIEIDLEEEVNIGNFTVSEPWRHIGLRVAWRGRDRSQEFALKYKKDGNWVDIINGKTTGSGYSQDFSPVSGRYFRLEITGPEGERPVLTRFVLNRVL